MLIIKMLKEEYPRIFTPYAPHLKKIKGKINGK